MIMHAKLRGITQIAACAIKLSINHVLKGITYQHQQSCKGLLC